MNTEITQEKERKIMMIKEIEQNKNCNCHTVNKEVSKIANVEIFHFCCKKCCDCQWEKLQEY